MYLAFLITTIFAFLLTHKSFAASMDTPVQNTPTGTIFRLLDRLEIVQHTDFILLGYDTLYEINNILNRDFNKNHNGRYTFQSFRDNYFLDNDSAYAQCIQNNQRFYRDNRILNSNNTMIIKGTHNTIMSSNNYPNGWDPNRIRTYVKKNKCQRPIHTYASLLIHKNNEQLDVGGGWYYQGDEFVVKSVSVSKVNSKYGLKEIRILFDHKLVKGIAIVTNTTDISKIKLGHLNYNFTDTTDFFKSMMEGLSNTTNIGGSVFDIILPLNVSGDEEQLRHLH